MVRWKAERNLNGLGMTWNINFTFHKKCVDMYNLFVDFKQEIFNKSLGTAFSLVFLVSGASYKALYKTSFASVLYDFALREREASQTKLMQRRARTRLY